MLGLDFKFAAPRAAGAPVVALDDFTLDGTLMGSRFTYARAQAHDGRVSVAQLPTASFADIPATTSTTATITLGATVYDQLEALADHDWIKITLAAGQHVTFLLSGFGGNELIDPYLYLRNAAGTVIAENDDVDPGVVRDSRIEFTATTAGTYYLDAAAWNNAYTGDYQLQVFDSASASDNLVASRATTAAMRYGGTYNGVLENRIDHDWVAIDLVAGQECVIRASGDGTTPLSNPTLALRGPDAVILAQNDNANGLDPEINFTAPTSGKYYIDVSSSGASGTGEYAISVSAPLPVFTYDQIANQLTTTYWGDGQHSFIVGADNSLSVNIAGLTAGGKALARAALKTWTDVLGITFVETTATAEIKFVNTGDGAFSSSTYNAAGRITSSEVNVSLQWLTDYGTSLDSYSMQTYIHEIGHALGLGHAGAYNGSANYPIDATFANDSWATTVMSYFSQTENSYFKNFSLAYLTTPMNGDVVAMADLYGASTTTRTGNTTYGFNTNAGNVIYNASLYADTAYCVVDSGGVDTLDYSGFAQNQLIDLHAETFMNIGGLTGNIVIGRGTVIEKAIGGSGADTINGNDVANIIFGNAGNDVISGFDAFDQLHGGDGDDTINGDGGNDNLYGDAGADTLNGGLGFDILNGGIGNDQLIGAQGNDTLNGDDGDDFLYGSGGVDILNGGIGNDLLNGGYGSDTLAGGDGADRLVGNEGADVLDGGAGGDTLVGGLGLDTLTGGADADRFQFSDPIFGYNADTITDFEHLVDKIVLDRAVFTALAANGPLAASAFVVGNAALDADDRIVYSRTTGELFYDADGVGGAGKVLFATVTPGTLLFPVDFLVTGTPPAAAATLTTKTVSAAAPLPLAPEPVDAPLAYDTGLHHDAFGLF